MFVFLRLAVEKSRFVSSYAILVPDQVEDVNSTICKKQNSEMIFKLVLLVLAVHKSISQPWLLTKPYTLELVVTMPIGGNIFPLGDIALEPIKMVVEIVNNRSDILPDYNIVVDVIDDQCDPAVGLDRTFGPFFINGKRAFNETNKIGQYRFPESVEFLHQTANSFLMPPVLAGPVCSSVCMVLANLVPTFNTIHVTVAIYQTSFLFVNLFFSHTKQFTGDGCNSIAMDDEERYPNTYRMWSAVQMADVAINFLVEMNWTSVAVISDSDEFNLQVFFFSKSGLKT